MLNQRDFCKKLMQKGYTKRDAEVIVRDVLATLSDVFIGGDDIHFRGFGRFEVRERPSRSCIDLQTKETIVVPAYKAVKFSAGQSLKRAIKEGYVRT